MSLQYDLELATEGLLAAAHDTGDLEKDWVDAATASETLHERINEHGPAHGLHFSVKLWQIAVPSFCWGIAVALVVIVLLLTTHQVRFVQPRDMPATQTSREYMPADQMELNQQRLFMQNQLFHPAERTAATEVAWSTLFERYVRIQRPEKYGLRPSEPHPFRPISEAYAIAGFHQTHCLSVALEHVAKPYWRDQARTTIRYAWYIATAPPETPTPYRPTNLAENVTLLELEGHVKHCLDYIRQSVECCADPALEPFVAEDGVSPLPHGSSGYGVVHQCRNFKSLAEWVEENRLTDFDPPEHAERRKTWPLDMSLVQSQLCY